jgi:hypothetical protein
MFNTRKYRASIYLGAAAALLGISIPTGVGLTTTPALAEARCDTPGTVNNRSSKTVWIQYDSNGVMVEKPLLPGESSPKYTCDADFFTVKAGTWMLRVKSGGTGIQSAGHWVKIYWNTVNCFDSDTYAETDVTCSFQG